jgi:hypothetical protein
MIDRHTANTVAFVIFVVLLVVGIGLISEVGPSFDAPEKKTTVVESSAGAGTGKETTSTEKGNGKEGKSSKATKTVETPTGAPSTKETVTVENGERSFLERSLGESGLIGLQVAIVVLASFLVAALVQRALVGDFSVKIANLELAKIEEGSTKNTTALAGEVTALSNKLNELSEVQKKLLESLADSVLSLRQDSLKVGRTLLEQQEELNEIAAKVKSIEGKLGA